VSVSYHDYYSILGVARDASHEEIRRAYRTLARKTHPDVDKTTGAAERFKRMNEAYEVLKDPDTRRRYDQLGANWKEGQEFTPPPDFDGAFRRARGASASRASSARRPHEGFSSFFESLFGDRFGHEFDAAHGRFSTSHDVDFDEQVGTPPPSEAELVVTLEELLRGAKRTLQLSTSGDAKSTRTVEVAIPRGTVDGSVVRLRGQGAAYPNGPADLLLRVRIAPHARFRVDGHDVEARLDVRPHQAVLGASVPFVAADGREVSIRVPAGSSSGRKLRLRGLGLPRRDDTRGDLIVEIAIVVPRTPSDDERRLYEELARLDESSPPV